MTATFVVQAKVLGQRRQIPDWSVPLSESGRGDHQRLRDLITRAVLLKISAFKERQAENQLVRILSPEAIEDGTARGKIDSGGHEYQSAVDQHVAVATALQGFVDGLYYVFVDGEQKTDLDGQVFIGPGSHVTFLRLTPLAGG